MSFLPQYTSYPLPTGGHTTSYQHFKDAQAEHAAVQAGFNAKFGATLSTPEGRRAVVDGMRAGALQKSGIAQIVPASPKFKGGLSEAEVNRRVDVASTGVTNRHGAEVFAIPSANGAQASGETLPAGLTRISFFGGA